MADQPHQSPLLHSLPSVIHQPIEPQAATLTPISRIVTRSQLINSKPNPKYHQNLTVCTVSPLSRNPISALHDPNWKSAMLEE